MTTTVTSWVDAPIASLDTETTGTDPASARCVEVAVVLVQPDGSPDEGGYRTLVDCGVDIPAEATRVHGITSRRARTEGVSSARCLSHVVALLERLHAQGVPLVVYNARFDWPLLEAEARRVGLALPPMTIIDPMVIDRTVDRYRRGKRRLVDLAEHYGVPLSGAHRAREDALAAARVAQAIARRFPSEVAHRSPRELHRLQVGWFAAWRDALNDWVLEQGGLRRVDGDWPR
jgi:DNA polymerase III subunit epsilon